ncbi:hypothetical protein ILUMI_23798 [Ignelater luminosus]|uniref:G-protein coupled receptor 143 n=1 Tax=Ignelater luminosus TaxID=2038154 RepID=A0A8K0CD75_IGNLU|nr:hypothetical protein ILUMI_23798 [Ignelater luminosus]
MADPTIQTFCCYTIANATYTASSILKEFNPGAYNFVSIFSSALGSLGAIYQLLPRRQFSRNHRWISFSAERGRRIILWLALTDLLASLGVLIRASLWLHYKNILPEMNDNYSVFFCTITSAWIQYFYTATWMWTLCYAIDMRFILHQKEEHSSYYHLVAWITPAVLTVIGLSLLYFPDANCHLTRTAADISTRLLPNYVATYIPITLVMILNPILYLRSCKDMERIITCSSGQFTKRERDIIDAVKIKFSAINLVFYVCWVPNLVNGVLLWSLWFQLPVNLVITIWYLMAFINPLQAFFNCLVYRRWNGESEIVVMPWSRHSTLEEPKSKSVPHSSSNHLEENLPLLQNFHRSLNR